MVTTFNKKDMVLFGLYCISLVDQGMKIPDEGGIISINESDIENWKIGEDLKKRKDYWFQLKNKDTGVRLELTGEQGYETCKDLQEADRKGEMFFKIGDLTINLSTGFWEWRDCNSISAPGGGEPWFMTGPAVIHRTV